MYVSRGPRIISLETVIITVTEDFKILFFFVPSYDSLYYCPTAATDDAPTTTLGFVIVHLYCLSTLYYYYYIVRTPTPSRLTAVYHYTIAVTC